MVAHMATKAKTAASYKKGQSGNPAGALPTELRFESAFKRVLSKALDAKTVEEYDGALNRMDRLAERAIRILEKTENEAVFFAGLDRIADRTEGKPQQKVDHTTLGEKLPTPILAGLSTTEESD
jgi:hypothetical protein